MDVIKRLGVWPAMLFMVVFFVLPLLALVPAAWAGHGRAFLRVFADPLFWPALRNTVLLGVGAAVVSALVGTLLAMELARLPAARRQIYIALLGLPLAFSGLVIAYGFILAFGRAGFVTQLLAGLGADPARVGSVIYSVPGLVFAYAYYLTPRVALSLYPVFASLDPAQGLAARTLGASRWRAWRDTVLVEVAPSIFSSAALVAALSMGTYGTALALAGTQLNILPLMLLARISEGNMDFAGASALSLVLLLVCVAIMGIGDIHARHRESGHH